MTTSERSAWICLACQRAHAGRHARCMRCGCPAHADEETAQRYRRIAAREREAKAAEDQAAANAFECSKCAGTEMREGELRAYGDGIASFLDVSNVAFRTVTCTRCGFTELYSRDIDPLNKAAEFLLG